MATRIVKRESDDGDVEGAIDDEGTIVLTNDMSEMILTPDQAEKAFDVLKDLLGK